MDAAVLYLFLFLAYLIPAFIAYGRSHNSAHAILACNLLLGWTFLGWVGALIWSFTGNVRQEA